MPREFVAPVRICLAGEDLDWLGTYHCCCIPVSLYTRVSLDPQGGIAYSGKYLTSVWGVLAERFARDAGLPPPMFVRSGAPTSSGLASSSSLTIALIRACCEYLGLPAPRTRDIVEIGYEAEARLTHGGGMDQLTIAVEASTYMEGRLNG